jgi:hypothetical protein
VTAKQRPHGQVVQTAREGEVGRYGMVRTVRPRYEPGPTGNPITDAVGAGLRDLFASTVDEPVPDYLIAVLLKIEETEQQAATFSDRINKRDKPN